jgi:hypothetical protein
MSHQNFVKELSRLDSSKTVTEKFRDFCELAYCAYAKLTASREQAETLENRYMQIVSTYPDKDTIRAYPVLLAQAYIAVNQGEDFLGHVAAEIGALDARAGQFFTPLHVCQLMAEIGLVGAAPLIRDQGFITLNEPTAGAGAMILAAADVLERQGFDPAFHMIVKAQDISQLCFHMCFLQLTFKGIPALVERANTLSMEVFEQAWTPHAFRFYQKHGMFFPCAD